MDYHVAMSWWEPLAAVASDPVGVPEWLVAALLSAWAPAAAFVWGALWGSFANVVIYRIPRGMSVMRPRSHCPTCERPVAAYDNVPILSYLLLRGRCRGCGAPFSMRYVLVELMAGVLSLALFLQFIQVPLIAGSSVSLWTWLLWFGFGLAAIVVTYVDLDFWIVPDAVVLPMAAVGLLVAVLAPSVLGTPWPWALGAAAAGYLLFAGIRWLYLRWRGIEALGLGDAKLLLMVGAFTGPQGLVWTIGAGAFQGLMVMVPLLLLGRAVANRDLHEVHGDDPLLGKEDPEAGIRGRRVPFGPFLAVAALEYVLLRPRITEMFAMLVDSGPL